MHERLWRSECIVETLAKEKVQDPGWSPVQIRAAPLLWCNMKNAVVINPHDDDGIIAIGGTLIQLIEKGWKIKYVQLTDGRHGSNIMSPEKTKKVRAKEIQKEIEFLGINSYVTFDIEDGKLASVYNSNKEGLVKKLAAQIASYKPLVVFIPSECEDHSDHRAAYELSHKAIQAITPNPLEIRYSVWSIPFKEHNPSPFEKLIAVEIKDQVKKKKQAIKLHKSQEKEGRYSKMVDAVNSYLALLYSAYKPYVLERVEVLAITKLNDNCSALEQDLSGFKDITSVFHGRSSEKIEA